MSTKDRIKELCKNNGISANKLEKNLGFAAGYISKLDKSTPNAKNIKMIADYFNVSVDYLMTGKDMEFTVETIDSTQELSEEEYKNACIELFYDDVFGKGKFRMEISKITFVRVKYEGHGNLRKPHPSPELEVSLVDTYNIHQYELKMFFYATRIFDNISQNYTVFIDSFVFGPTIPSTTNPCFA